MKLFKRAAIALFALVGTTTLVTGAVVVKAASVDPAPNTDFTVDETYFLGETISTEGASLLIGSQKIPAESVLYTPDGRARSAGNYVLDKLGRYTLELVGRFEGKTHKISRSFTVGESIATFSQAGASYELTERGLSVSLNEGNTLTVNRTIDITQATVDDEIVTISVDPEVAGVADFTKITVTLTDVENSDSYLRVLLQASPVNPAASYGLAGATNQALTGYEKEWNRIHKNNQWGAFMPFTFYGMAGAFSELGIRYDQETKEVYALKGYSIIDLDNPEFFPNTWKGFESGKVRVSVQCASYASDFAHFTVKSFMGNRVAGEFVSDTVPPDLKTDYEGDMPYAVVGKAFPLLACTATDDLSGALAVHAEVWYRYGYSNGYHVDSVGGTFTPDREGDYTIVYSATDAFGNKAILPVAVKAVKSGEPLSLALTGNAVTSGELGYKVAVSDYRVDGGSGRANVKVTAKLNGEEVELTDGFTPEKAGTWTIVYTATDYIGNTAEQSYTFTATAGEKPMFVGQPQLPRYFIAGKNYTFSAVKVLDYTSGSRVDRESDIYLTIAGLRQKLTPGFSVRIEGGRTAELEYVCGGTSFKKSVPIVQTVQDGKLNMESYFDTTAQKLVDAEGVHFTATSPSQVTFIRELLAEGLTARFEVSPNSGSELRVVLTDYENPEEALTLLISAQDNGYALRVNGVFVWTGTDIGFTSSSRSNEFNLLYEDGGISLDGITLNKISNYIDFAGFSSGRVYLDIFFGGASGGSLTVKTVNRQPTNSVSSDRIRPRIVVTGEYGGEKNLGDELVLRGADALDVLDPTLTFTLTVTDPSGNPVVDANGRKLENVDGRGEYRFTVTSYGNYRVAYTAVDSSNNSQPFTYIIPVDDKIAPEVVFKTQFEASYAVGERVELPKFNVSDNVTAAEKLSVYRYLLTPFGRNISISAQTEAVTLSECGIYTYCVVVYDEAGNMQTGTLRFQVTEVKA